jgi:hypothetical protein
MEAKTITGTWKFNSADSKKLTPSQAPLLKAIGRRKFERWAVPYADETTTIILTYVQKNGKKKPPRFEKYAHHSLKGKFLEKARLWFESSEKKKEYQEDLIANSKLVEHADDEKGFGPSTSVARYLKGPMIVVDWTFRTKKGKGDLVELRVVHELEKGRLKVTMIASQVDGSKVINIKLYDRVEPDDRIKNHEDAEYMI